MSFYYILILIITSRKESYTKSVDICLLQYHSPQFLHPPHTSIGVNVLTACACVCLTDAEIKVVKILVRRPNLRKFDGAGLINQLLPDINDRRFSLTTGADIRVFVFRGWGPKLLLDQPTPALLFLYVSSNDINYQASVV